MLGRAASQGHDLPALRRSRYAQEHHEFWRHVGLAEPLGTVGLVCWCPEGHCGDVPHKLEGARPPSQDRWEGVSSSFTHCPSRRVTLQGTE